MKEGERGIKEDSAQVLAWGTGWKGACTGREHSLGSRVWEGQEGREAAHLGCWKVEPVSSVWVCVLGL